MESYSVLSAVLVVTDVAVVHVAVVHVAVAVDAEQAAIAADFQYPAEQRNVVGGGAVE